MTTTVGSTEHGLPNDALLGLAPDTPLPLADLPRFDPAALSGVTAALDHLGKIRPDLMALRAGYDSPEQTLREAVLSQFPSIGIGISPQPRYFRR